MNIKHRRASTTEHPPMVATRLLDQLHERIRYLHYSLRTEQAYVHWTKTFIRFHRMRHPRDMGGAEVEAFLSHMTTYGNVSVSTHRQALSALLFLYREVLGMDLPWMNEMARPTARPRIPSVLMIDEVAAFISHTEGETGLLAHNFAILRRIVLNLIKKEKSTKASVKLKHKRASWSPDYLGLLFGLVPHTS